MNTSDDTLKPVLGLAHGKTIGGEPAFSYPDVLDALSLCTANEIAVLGVELFRAHPDGYSTGGMSTYEVQPSQSWHSFVVSNNALATEFVNQNRAGDDHFYLLTASLEGEFSSLTSR